MKFITALRDKGMMNFFISLNRIKSILNCHTLDQQERCSRSLEGPSVRLSTSRSYFFQNIQQGPFIIPLEKPSGHCKAGNTAFSLESWASRAPWSLPVRGLGPLVSSFWLHLRFCYLETDRWIPPIRCPLESESLSQFLRGKYLLTTLSSSLL